MEAIVVARYAFCDFSNIVGFPHIVLTITKWGDYLPRFKGSKCDYPSDHLLNFHKCILEHDFVHEDVSIKMFKFSLEKLACEWCQSLPAANIHSLKEFHTIFYHHYKIFYSTDLLFENCCKEFEFNIQLSISIRSGYKKCVETTIEHVKEELSSYETFSSSLILNEESVDKDVGDSNTVDTFELDSNISSSFDYDTKDALNSNKEQIDDILFQFHARPIDDILFQFQTYTVDFQLGTHSKEEWGDQALC